MATIKEISKITGVSPAAVSRVLNGDASLSVSHEKKMRILKVAEDLEYVTVKERKTNLIKSERMNFGILDWYSEIEQLDDPYYLYLMTMIEKQCSMSNIDTFKINRYNSSAFNFKSNIDGIIAIGKFSDKEISQLPEFSKNIVFVDSSPYEKRFDSVTINYRLGISDALEYLIDLGHTQIGFIGGIVLGNYREETTDDRKILFSQIMEEHGLYNPEFDFVGKNISFNEGYELMKNTIIKSKNIPTAFFIANDTMATGALRALHEAKIQVPNDISIIGFNDLATSKYLTPPLTSVSVPLSFMAECAIDLLLERITKDRVLPKKVLVPTELKIRKSCLKR